MVEAAKTVDGAIAIATGTDSYWNAPTEKALDGKTLSTMDISMLDAQRPSSSSSSSSNDDEDDDKDATGEATPRRPSTHSSYWDWQEKIVKKTLSTLSLSNLHRSSREKGNVDGDDDSDQQSNRSRESGKNTGGSGDGGGYWLWKNPSLKNLSSVLSLPSLERAVKKGEETQNNDGNPETTDSGTAPARRRGSGSTSSGNGVGGGKGGGGGYWFWRNPSLSKISFSNASLETLERKARGDGVKNCNERGVGSVGSSSSSSSGGGGGPITNLQHKLRNSWRASFNHLSSNSLTRLNEVGGGGGGGVGGATAFKQGWMESRKRSMSERSNSAVLGGNTNEEIIICEENEHVDEDEEGAITF